MNIIRCAALSVLVIVFFVSVAWGQQKPPLDADQHLREFGQKLDSLAVVVSKIGSKVNSHDEELVAMRYLAWSIAAVGGVLATLAGLGAAVWQISQGSRQRDRDELFTKTLKLFHAGEAAGQKRASQLHNVMLKEGQITLKLVNDTLGLAKQASESAVAAGRRRATKARDDLDKKVRLFLQRFEDKDTRDIVDKREHRDRLTPLIDELNIFEYINMALGDSPDDQLKLTPNCLFLKALENYLDQQFNSAIECLEDAINHEDITPDLKIRSWSWKGYEQNNIGHSIRAEVSFRNAISIAETNGAPSSRLLELERLKTETMLFKDPDNAEVLVGAIEHIVNECDRKRRESPGIGAVLDRAVFSHSNILYAAALSARRKGMTAEEIEWLRKAKGVLTPCKSAEKAFAEREWSLICFALNEEQEEAKDLLRRKVLPEVGREITDKVGPRHKAYFSAVRMMINIALGEEEEVAIQSYEVEQYIGDVHELAMVYSPFRKRLVTRRQFLDDVEYAESHGSIYFV